MKLNGNNKFFDSHRKAMKREKRRNFSQTEREIILWQADHLKGDSSIKTSLVWLETVFEDEEEDNRNKER